MYFVYILYSNSIDQFYIGETGNIDERIKQHNSGFYDGSFTKKASDWKLYYSIECNSRVQSRKIENHIKKMKSKVYIQNLFKHSEISQSLKDKYE